MFGYHQQFVEKISGQGTIRRITSKILRVIDESKERYQEQFVKEYLTELR